MTHEWFIAPEIYNKLNKTILRTLGVMLDKTRSGRQRAVRTKQFIASVKRKLSFTKKLKSAYNIAKDEGCSDSTARRIIHMDLSVNKFKKTRVRALTVDHIQREILLKQESCR